MEQHVLRYELKMTFDGQRLFETRRWVRLHSQGFREAYPPRQVNNIYFDTPDLSFLNDHMSGVDERRKLRYRWYGADLQHACGHLEDKERSGRIGWKDIQPVEPLIDLTRLTWNEVTAIIAAQVTGHLHELICVSRPVMINTYQREYYCSSDGEVRLTLDYGQVAYDQRLSARPNLAFRLPLRNQMLIEIKSAADNGKQLADVLAEFPLRVGRHSKYVDIMSSMVER
jgi:hypothetical protein